MYKTRRARRMRYWASVTHKSSIIDTLLIQNMVVETECDDFISWLLSRAPISILAKKRRICSVYPARIQKGHVVTPRDCSQSNVSATFRVYVAVCRMHKGSPFKYAGMKFNPQHPFPARLCLVATIDAASGSMQRAAILRACFFFLNLCESFLVR